MFSGVNPDACYEDLWKQSGCLTGMGSGFSRRRLMFVSMGTNL